MVPHPRRRGTRVDELNSSLTVRPYYAWISPRRGAHSLGLYCMCVCDLQSLFSSIASVISVFIP